jgi:hypothetical protein
MPARLAKSNLPPTALVVADALSVRRHFARTLQEVSPDFVVVEASTLDEARRRLERERFAFVLIGMEQAGDGLRVLEVPGIDGANVIFSRPPGSAAPSSPGPGGDFLVKQIERGMLTGTLERLQREHSAKAAARGGAPGREAAADLPERRHILVGERDKCHFIRIATIVALCSYGNYSMAHLADGTHHLISRSLGTLEECAGFQSFVRASRKCVINPDFILEINKLGAGNLTATLSVVGTVEFSRRQAQEFRARFEI